MIASLVPSVKWGHKTLLLPWSKQLTRTHGHKSPKLRTNIPHIRVHLAPESGWQESDARVWFLRPSVKYVWFLSFG